MKDSNIDYDFSAPIAFAKRANPESLNNSPYRSEFMRDRDRVMYCGSFRRLSGKTQIYLTGTNDNQRNRLTHTLEVSQIARTVSQALRLNCDLTEAIALGHDMGHTPFGHAGEQILHEIMVPGSAINIKNSPMTKTDELIKSGEINLDQFGFKHNIQSVRIAVSVENNYGGFGLNLTNYTLWGILHHSGIVYKKNRVNTDMNDPNYRKQYDELYNIPGYVGREAWSFEAFVVAECDEIAQWHHDLEDALRGNAMSGPEVCKTIRKNLGEIMSTDDLSKLNALNGRKIVDRKYISELSRIVVNTLVNRLIYCSNINLEKLYTGWMEAHNSTFNKEEFFCTHNYTEKEIYGAIKLSCLNDNDRNIQSLEKEYPSIISEKIHHSKEVERMNIKGQYIIKKLFQAYYANPQQLLDSIIIQYLVDIGQYKSKQQACLLSSGAIRTKFEKVLTGKESFGIHEKIILMRKICDHIAGMTDRYAIEEYKNLYE